MTLGNMRALGVRSLSVTCELCHHEAFTQTLAAAGGTAGQRPARSHRQDRSDRLPAELPVSTGRRAARFRLHQASSSSAGWNGLGRPEYLAGLPSDRCPARADRLLAVALPLRPARVEAHRFAVR
jgi:hypothetical protein